MVIESSPDHRDLLEVFLETMGFSMVWTFRDASALREAYRQAVPSPSIVIIDHHLEVSDGLRLVYELVQEDASVRIVFLSTDPEAERECYKAGAIEFIRKPYSLAEVGRAINRAMRPGVVS